MLPKSSTYVAQTDESLPNSRQKHTKTTFMSRPFPRQVHRSKRQLLSQGSRERVTKNGRGPTAWENEGRPATCMTSECLVCQAELELWLYQLEKPLEMGQYRAYTITEP